MNTIAPGPFNVMEQQNTRTTGHTKTATIENIKRSVRSSSSSSGSSQDRRPSTATSVRPRNPSLSSIAGGPRSTVHREVADSPTLPAMPPLAAELTQSPERQKADTRPSNVEHVRQESQSQIFPQQGPSGSKSDKPQRHPRRPSEPAIAAVMKPLHEIGSTSSFKPSRSLKGRRTSPNTDTIAPTLSSNNESGNDSKMEDVPPVPKSIQARDRRPLNPYHTPTESNSSNESSGSDARSVSSRSTPPLSGSPHRPKRRISSTAHIDNLLQDFRFGTEPVPVIEEPKPPHRTAPSFSRPMYARADRPPPLKDPATLLSDSLTDPAIQMGRPSPLQTPSDYFSPTIPLQNGTLHLSPAPLPPPPIPADQPTRKATTAATKGNCRGCSEPIRGKSVSSADGRLTGRYHRSCFVCKTCRAPFATADFYVLDDHPYCARHYHELNQSLCRACDGGIEGQYLETEGKGKFHPECFVCQVCRLFLLISDLVSASTPNLPASCVYSETEAQP